MYDSESWGVALEGTGHARAAVETARMNAAKPTIRLQAAAALAPLGPDVVVADVATGRAELALYLAASRLCARVIAIDSSPRAIANAAEEVERAGLPVPVVLRVGDGLAPIARGEADVIVIAGIGGRLMVRLLNNSGADPADGLVRLLGDGVGPTLVLQPMSEPKLVRRWAESRGGQYGYQIAAEQLVKDAGRFYHTFLLSRPVHFDETPDSQGYPLLPESITAAAGTIAWEEIGPYLLAGPDPLLYEYLAWRQTQLEHLARKAVAGGSEAGFKRAGAALTVLAALARLEIALRESRDA